ncbi:hypothetical protein O3G_MSEX010860 [Manduca sexta]|uniref:Endonuclease/exonuclease/phosphatase domain-containing protein n=1 Tax=Manduca sexta TaxID=7130 RepID=A0A922CU42_MANSE|nr:hypothetical protein O3G_MSEX010860 [Manduca sexta]
MANKKNSKNNQNNCPTNNNINIIQCNLDRSYNSYQELLQYLEDNSCDIALISEPYVGKALIIKTPPGYDVHQFPADDEHPMKAAIIINKTLGYTLGISQFSSTNLATMLIKIGNRNIYISSVYVEPNEDKNNTILKLERFIDCTKDSHRIIGGNFNGWHQVWGSPKANKRGIDVMNLIINKELTVCNIGEAPTFENITHGKLRQSIIDRTIATPNLSNQIHQWKVSGDVCTTSQHNAISYILALDHKPSRNKSQTTYKYNTNDVYWDIFTTQLTKGLEAAMLTNTDDIAAFGQTALDEYIDKITKTIQTTCKRLFPTKRKFPTRAPFWNDKLEQLKSQLFKIHHNISTNKSRGMPYEELQKEQGEKAKEYSAAIRQESTAHFRNFCSFQGKENVFSLTNRLLKCAPPRKPPATLYIDGKYTNNAQDTAAAIIQKFFPDNDRSEDNPTQEKNQTRLMQHPRYSKRPTLFGG